MAVGKNQWVFFAPKEYFAIQDVSASLGKSLLAQDDLAGLHDAGWLEVLAETELGSIPGSYSLQCPTIL
jgi:hypothetical protein